MRASVIIPCRDAERTVADAVASALRQSEQPLEVLVVDDASSDA
jgi:glycosyltransferase involved in cell wall biosynthesis